MFQRTKMKCHLLYLLKPYIVRTYHSQHHPLDRESFCTSRILPWNIVYCLPKMSLFVHSCWTESGNKSSHENISILISHLMFIVIIIRVNSFRLAADSMHYGKSKFLIWGCGSERSHVIELQWTPERGGGEGEERCLESQYREGHLQVQYQEGHFQSKHWDRLHFQCRFPALGASFSSHPLLSAGQWGPRSPFPALHPPGPVSSPKEEGKENRRNAAASSGRVGACENVLAPQKMPFPLIH